MNYIASSYESDSSDDEEKKKVLSEESKADYFGLASSSETNSDLEETSDENVLLSHTQTLINAYELNERLVGPSELPSDVKICYKDSNKRPRVDRHSSSHKRIALERHQTADIEVLTKLSTQLNEPHPLINTFSSNTKAKECFLPESANKKSFQRHKRCVNAVQWGPRLSSHHMILSASMDGLITIWDTLTKHPDSVVYANTVHGGSAVRCAQWHPVEDLVLSGGYDKQTRITNIVKGVEVRKYVHSSYVNCLKIHPDQTCFLTGFSGGLSYWDMRQKSDQAPVRNFSANFNEVKDIEFLPGGNEFICCSNLVSRDSADRNIVAWDLRTGAVLSNQIYHERYHCTCLRLHPEEKTFLAQTNGNYIASFSVKRPYKMNKNLRYEGHKVEGYWIGFDVSSDGQFVYSGSSDGKIYAYNFYTGKLMKVLNVANKPCIAVETHPILPSTIAVSTWNGQVDIYY